MGLSAMALLLDSAFEFVTANDAVVSVGVVAGEPALGAPVERRRHAEAQLLSHLRHVQPLFARPLLAQIGGQLGIGDGAQTDEVLMLRAAQPVPEIG